jgi:hypothetical protein
MNANDFWGIPSTQAYLPGAISIGFGPIRRQ